MTTREVFMAGLPGAGKTTFIAALWHQVFACDSDTELAYDSIEGLDVSYLNQLRMAWLQAKKPERTKIGQERTAVLNLKNRAGDTLRLSLEDFAGEGFRRMWTRRRASTKIVDLAQRSDRYLLIVNIAKVVYPRTANELAIELSDGEPDAEFHGNAPIAPDCALQAGTPFDARKCPTAAQVTDVLQHLFKEPIAAKPAKVAIALTAWDEVAEEGKAPAELLAERLPLLAQYLDAQREVVEVRLFGVSAQGGSYDTLAARERMLAITKQSDRLQLIDGKTRSHDLTRMLAWLLE